VHLNETDFPEPHNFVPERFTEGREYPGILGHSAFGWGRRVCPGMYLGSASVAINIARILWAFNIAPAKDESGKDIEVDMYVQPTRSR
jgi:cytochrome P450